LGGSADLGKPSSPGSRARSDARTNRAKGPKKGGVVAEAWLQNPSKRTRPAAANRLAKQLHEGGNGLFGRFSARPAPDPRNPGCAGEPKSITALSSQNSPDYTETIETFDGKSMDVTNKSLDHLLPKHGHDFDIDDRLPVNPNQKATKHETSKIRTRLTPENRTRFRKNLKQFGQNETLVPYYDVDIRGIKEDVYYCPITRRCIATILDPNSGKRILTKAQPLDRRQVERLETQHKLE